MTSVTNLTFAGFARILVATDGSPTSDHAIAWARQLATMRPDARVWVAHIVPHPHAMRAFGAHAGPGPDPVAERLKDNALLERALRALDHPRAEAVLGFGDAAHEIVSLASGVRADVVIMGSQSRHGVEGWLLGSVSSGVKDACESSVLIARAQPARGPVLVALDGSSESRNASQIAAFLASRWDASLNAVHVSLPSLVSHLPEIVVPEGATFLESIAVDKRGVATEIASQAEALNASLVVAGNHQLGKVRRAIAGSVGHQLARDARASVLLVRGAAKRPS